MSDIIIEYIVTGQVFSDATYENFICTYNAGEGLYQVFVDEWLKPDSKVSIFAQLRKAIKEMEIKKQGYQNKIERQSCDHERRKSFYIKNDKNSWIESRWQKHHTGKHELAPAINSLMMRDGTFLGYWEGKLKLAANVAVLQDISFKS